MGVHLVVLPTEGWAAAVASDVVARLRGQPDLRLCLPTGDTPSPVYALLVEAIARGDASLDRATVVLLDEYVGLPPGDPARCDGRLRRELLDRVPRGPRAFHPVPVDELAPEKAAAAHDAVAAEGIDLCLLGLGGNGHVGLNEPGSAAESPTRVVTLAPESRDSATGRYGAERVPEAGITLGLARLLETGELWLLVTGARKAEILRRVLREPQTAECPGSFLRRHPRLRVLADEPAAALL